MSTLALRIRIKPEGETRFLEIASEMIEIMRVSEPETRLYGVWRTGNPQEYFLLQSYLTRAAFDFHEEQHLAYLEEFQSLMAEQPKAEFLGDFAVGFPDVGTLPFEQQN